MVNGQVSCNFGVSSRAWIVEAPPENLNSRIFFAPPAELPTHFNRQSMKGEFFLSPLLLHFRTFSVKDIFGMHLLETTYSSSCWKPSAGVPVLGKFAPTILLAA